MTEPEVKDGDFGLGESPLAAADPASLDKLLTERLVGIFNTMPSKLKLTGDDNDLDIVVSYYRSKRSAFMLEETKRLAEGPKVKGAGKVAGKVTSVAQVLSATNIDFDSI